MASLVYLGLANALGAAVLAVLVAAAGWRCRRPALVHGLWVVVLIKLLAPPVVPVPLPWLPAPRGVGAPSLAPPASYAGFAVEPDPPAPRAGASAKAAPGRTVRVVVPRGNGPVPVQAPEAFPGRAAMPAAPPRPGATTEPVCPVAGAQTPAGAVVTLSRPWDVSAWAGVIGLVWLAGCLGWFSWAGTKLYRFQRLLRFARPAPAHLQAEVETLATRLGLWRCPAVLLLPGPLPPMVWATVGPARLLFPSGLLERLDDEQRASLLVHELAHLRRRDHWVRWLELIVAGLYWWYPLVWWVRRQLQLREEESCDAWVVAEVSPRAYATAIVDTVDFLAEARPPLPVLASGFRYRDALRRRLTLIVQNKTPRGMSGASRTAVLAAGAGALALAPVFVLAQSEKKPAPLPAAAAPAAPTPDARQEPARQKAGPGVAGGPVIFAGNPLPLHRKAPVIWSVAFSPDRKTLAVAGGGWDEAGELTLWNWPQRRLLAVVPERTGIRGLAFAPDGQTLATADYFDQTAKLRDAATGQVRVVYRHGGGVNGVVFSPDGKTLATAGLDQVIKIWDVAGGKEIRVLTGHTQGVFCVAFSPDGKLLASAGGDMTARLWDVATGKERAVLKGHANAVEYVAFSPDGKTLATASWDRKVHLWDVATGRIKASLAGHAEAVLCVAFSPDGKRLAAATGRWGDSDFTPGPGEVRVWDVSGFKLLTALKGHTDRVFSAAFAPDGKALATGSWDRSVRLWDAEAGREAAVLQHGGDRAEKAFAVFGLAYAPDGKTLAVAGEEPAVQLWDLAGGKLRIELPGHADGVTAVAYSPDGAVVATAGPDKMVRLWDARTGKELRTLSGHTSWVYALAFSPDGRTVASAGYDKTVRLWELAAGKELAVLKGHTAGIRAVGFSPDGKVLASGASDRTVRLWDVASLRERAVLKGHLGTVRALGFSPDGATLATGSEDATVRLWNVAAGKERAVLEGHANEVWSLAFSLDGRTLASGSLDRTIKVWDPVKPALQTTLQGHSDGVSALAFSPNGRELASGSFDGTVKLWHPADGGAQGALQDQTRSSQPGLGGMVPPEGSVRVGGRTGGQR